MSPQEGEGGAQADSTTMDTTPEATTTPPAAVIAVSEPPGQEEGGSRGQPTAPGSPTHDQRNKKKKRRKNKKKNAQAPEEGEEQQQQDDGDHAPSPPIISTTPLNMTPPRSPRARSPFGPGSPARTPKKHLLIPPNLDIFNAGLLVSGMGSNNGAPSLPNTPSRSPSRRSRHVRRAKAVWTIKKRVVFLIFALGTIFGISAACWYFRLSYSQYLPSLPPNLNLNISAVLPAGLGLGLGGGDLNSTILSDIYGYMSGASTPETYPGLDAKAKNYSAKYPIVLIPGFVTTGLEVWQGEECASSLFRSRLWGALSMLQVHGL
jgi:hypothetical protein